MKSLRILFISLSLLGSYSWAQSTIVEAKTRTFRTTEKVKVEGTVGYLNVPENRSDPESRDIRVKFIHLKSLSETPATPVIYLEGGGGACTWQAEKPSELSYWLEILEVSDLIFLDRRGTGDKGLEYRHREAIPRDFFVSEEKATAHIHSMIDEALPKFEERGIDVKGYNLVEEALDVVALADGLGLEQFNLFAFSFGTSISMAVMQLYPERVERAILVGADAPWQSFNFPSRLDLQLERISAMAAQDSALSAHMPDFGQAVAHAMDQLAQKPAVVSVRHPLTLKKMELEIGPFGLGLILRLDMDDASDIPVLPRLIYSIGQGKYDMLTWFVQKRLLVALGIPGSGLHQGLASGVSEARWERIETEAGKSMFGNAVNFPFSAARTHWVPASLPIELPSTLQTDIPTLFVTGSLDVRTSVAQVNEIMQGFSRGTHVVVEHAGHEQTMWAWEVFDEDIPAFLQAKPLPYPTPARKPLRFLPLTGPTEGHPSVR